MVPPVSGVGKNGRGMRPAGGDRRSPLEGKDATVTSDGPVVRRNIRVPLSV